MFSILIVEDNDNTRKLMSVVLQNAGYTALTATDGAEALEMMDHHHVDLAVVDIMMPHMNGYEFTRTLREGNCDLPILMVTAKVSQEDKKEGFAAGVDDYMIKPVDEEELLWRIAALLRRAKSASEHRISVGETVLDHNDFTVTRSSESVTLAPKEFLLLYKFLASPRRLFTKRQLIDEIWGMDSDTDEHSVEVHINRLREKFRNNKDFEIRTIRGFGYMGITGDKP